MTSSTELSRQSISAINQTLCRTRLLIPHGPPGTHASAPWEALQIIVENASTKIRSAGTVIEEEFELVSDEKGFLGDLFAHWLDMRHPAAPATALLRRQFFDLIIQGWDSGFEPNQLPKPINNSPQHIAVPVSKFKENLPVKVAGLELSTKWRDKEGGFADAEYVKLNDGITMVQAVEKAIRHWDCRELKLLEKYNTKLIISLAQSRIQLWGESGATSAISPPLEHLGLNGRLRQPELMSDGLKKMASNLSEVSEAMSKREE